MGWILMMLFCFWCSSSGVVALSERCLEEAPDYNDTCEDPSSWYSWSETVQACMNLSVCENTLDNGNLFTSEDQCLKSCSDSASSEEIPKECFEKVQTRCAATRVVARPVTKYSYSPQTQDCEEITIVKCPPEYLNGPNIFDNIAECRQGCRVKFLVITEDATASESESKESKPLLNKHVMATPSLVEDIRDDVNRSVVATPSLVGDIRDDVNSSSVTVDISVVTLTDPGGGSRDAGMTNPLVSSRTSTSLTLAHNLVSSTLFLHILLAP